MPHARFPRSECSFLQHFWSPYRNSPFPSDLENKPGFNASNAGLGYLVNIPHPLSMVKRGTQVAKESRFESIEFLDLAYIRHYQIAQQKISPGRSEEHYVKNQHCTFERKERKFRYKISYSMNQK